VRSPLDDELEAARTVAQVSRVVVDHLVSRGLTKPSVYLVRGDRMRIQAVEGYQQIFDGMPFSAGVIGRAYVGGEPVIIPDVLADSEYLRANPAVRAEACIPLRIADRVVGVLNVESDEPLADTLVDEVLAAARSLERALERVGHDLTESPPQRLVRHAVRLTALSDEREIKGEVVAAACDVAGMSSGMLLLPDGERFTAAEAAGPLAAGMAGAGDAAISAIAALVQSGCSCYTVGGTTDTAEELSALRSAGAEAVIAVPLGPGPHGRGVLVLADARPLVPATETVELLELLAAHASSCLRTAAAVVELRDRAATDPLTGLGHHATFHDALGAARAGDEPIAVLLADIDGFKYINDTRGHQAGDRVLRETAAALAGALRRDDELFRIGGDEFAAILRVETVHEALDVGRRLREAVSDLREVTVSIGVAVPAPGEPDHALLARADAALYAVKAEGRDGVALLP
jgi:diguanylate cyclase (GGDEF)-like protein